MSGAPHFERLTALDAGFLVAETPTTPMHIGAVITVERAPFVDAHGRVRLDRVRRYVEARLHLVPRLRQVLREVPFALGRPVWVDDPAFDIEHHVRLLALPAPGDERALFHLVEELAMTLLDRGRPLWEWWVIDGLDPDGTRGGTPQAAGRLAFFVKMHHCIVDGVGGVEILAAFTDPLDGPLDGPADTRAGTSADSPVDAPADTHAWSPRPAPTGARLLASSATDTVRSPWQAVGAVVAVARTGRRGVSRATGALGALAAMARPSARAPALSLNRPVGRHRRLRTLTFDVDDLKQVAHAHHTALNDVVLTITAGGLRALLQARGEPLVGQRVQALVPADIRPDPGRRSLGNRITGFFVPLPVDDDDPVTVLHRITSAVRHERGQHADDKAADLLAVADHAPYPLVRGLRPVIDAQPWVNTLVTNVPGPDRPLTVDGSRVLTVAPIVPLSGNITVGVAALSYAGTLTLTVNACRDACPDIDEMIGGMRVTARALMRDVRAPRSGRGARASRRRSAGRGSDGTPSATVSRPRAERPPRD